MQKTIYIQSAKMLGNPTDPWVIYDTLWSIVCPLMIIAESFWVLSFADLCEYNHYVTYDKNMHPLSDSYLKFAVDIMMCNSLYKLFISRQIKLSNQSSLHFFKELKFWHFRTCPGSPRKLWQFLHFKVSWAVRTSPPT